MVYIVRGMSMAKHGIDSFRELITVPVLKTAVGQ